jgi:hypothetical protein
MTHHRLSIATLALLACVLSAPAATASHHDSKAKHAARAAPKATPASDPAPLAGSADGAYRQPPAFTRDFARRIKPGTPLEKVEALIGQPGTELTTGHDKAARNLYWIGQHHSNFSVSLDAADKVMGWNLIDKDDKSWGMDGTGKILGPY